MTTPYDWHTSAALAGMGHDKSAFVFSVQRYLRPDEAERYTGEILLQSFTAEGDAQVVADRLNADSSRPHSSRRTYL
jgi:hypothetical protein